MAELMAMPSPYAVSNVTRWTCMKLHAKQKAYWDSPHRFNVVPAGRRSGKTELAKRKLVRKALTTATPWAPAFFAAAPTRDQAKRIYWEDLKALTRGLRTEKPSETELKITLVTGAAIWVLGLDKPERVEGSPWDGGILDEYGNTKPKAWPTNVRPALSDRNGWCDLIGVPEGRNHYYDLDLEAIAMMEELGAKSEWGHFHWTSGEVLPLYGRAAEVEAAKRDLDELTYDQEYNASFVNFSGRAYYTFDSRTHCKKLAYNPLNTLDICFDFNVEPGVAVICQEQVMPGQYERGTLSRDGRVVYNAQAAPLLDRPLTGTGVIGEVHIPRNSNTPAVCRRIVKDWGAHKGRVVCYGDATGGARGTAQTDGSDWDLIEKELRPTFKDRLSFKVKPANPAERARINAVNARLKSITGDIRLMVDPSKAPNLIKDLDGVTTLEGGSGEIDKKKNPLLTHMTDALGYRVEYDFPVSGEGVVRVQIAGH
jgi:hypothetical protein